jgi:hypothetical protein
LAVQQLQGSRAGIQIIVEKIGLLARAENNEAYYHEALDYHLGILYAYVADSEKAAFHFERSGTHPSGGGNNLFSEHQYESVALRRRQELAIERGIPSISIASMPRSASASLTQTLAATLQIPIMRISSGRFPSFIVIPRWLNSFSPGGAILHDHFGAQAFNLKTLRAGGIREVFVRVRDPRAAAVSAAHLENRKYSHVDSNFAEEVTQLYEYSFIPWTASWIAAGTESESDLKIHWLTQPSKAIPEMARHVLSILMPQHPDLQQFLQSLSEIKANYVTGDAEAWRNNLSAEVQDRLWQATPSDVKDFLELKP